MKAVPQFVFIILIGTSINLVAQGPPSPGPPPPPGTPISNGLIFLLIAGLFYGIKKIRD